MDKNNEKKLNDDVIRKRKYQEQKEQEQYLRRKEQKKEAEEADRRATERYIAKKHNKESPKELESNQSLLDLMKEKEEKSLSDMVKESQKQEDKPKEIPKKNKKKPYTKADLKNPNLKFTRKERKQIKQANRGKINKFVHSKLGRLLMTTSVFWVILFIISGIIMVIGSATVVIIVFTNKEIRNELPDDFFEGVDLEQWDALGGDSKVSNTSKKKTESNSGTSSDFNGEVSVEGTIEGVTFVGEDNGNYVNVKAYEDIFIKYGKQFGIDPYLMMSVSAQESGGTVDADNGAAFGIMQIELNGMGVSSREIKAIDRTTNQEVTEVVGYDNMRGNVDLQIKAGIMQFQASTRSELTKNNSLYALAGYNQGMGGLKQILGVIGDKPFTMANYKEGATYYKYNLSPNYGDPNYLTNVLRYYNQGKSKEVWHIGDDGKKHVLEFK